MRVVLVAALLLLGGAAASLAATEPATASSCAAGPTTVGDTIVGTPCDDTIVVPPRIEAVRGGAGDDRIVAAPIPASYECSGECDKHLGVGSQTFDGGPGNDVIFGERGNDILNGGEGDDRLYGGPGDDELRGGPGNDLLSGGFGADSLDGESGSDFVRGDATLDKIFDSGGGSDVDTLSYATGVTPGFSSNPGKYPNFAEFPGFPTSPEGRGVFIDLEAGIGDNGVAPDGGGLDGAISGELTGTDFEKVIGTPFSDFILGSSDNETIYGGGGADVILGGGGDDRIFGGADGDHLDGGSGQDTIDGGAGNDSCEGYEPASPNPCEAGGKAVAPRDASKVAAGIMAPQEGGAAGLYLTGASGDDKVTATYAGGSPPTVAFALEGGSFDPSSSVSGGCDPPAAGKVVCELAEAPDSVLLAGMGGGDTLSVAGFPDSTSIVALGGDGNDSLAGGDQNEDVLADGPGNDHLSALGGDDVLLNNAGTDSLDGGGGSDLFLSDSICGDDLINGGAGDYRDNASWTKLKEPVAARLDTDVAGRPVDGQPSCSGGGSLDHLQTIEDLEGTSQGDFFYGDGGNNQLLGHLGPDTYFALGGDDTILANSGDSDLVIDCGDGNDTAFIDIPTAKYADPTPVGCEKVYETAPDDFKPPDTPTGPPAEPSPVPAPVKKQKKTDVTPPRTKLLHRPARNLFAAGRRRTVTFAFASNESGATFRCKVDHGRFRPCRSPRAYRLAPGKHAFRVFAIDRVGNRDSTPALFAFRIRRR